jgi:hypothetical protein
MLANAAIANSYSHVNKLPTPLVVEEVWLERKQKVNKSDAD